MILKILIFRIVIIKKIEHDYEVENLTRKTVRAGAQYSFSFEPFVISPFKSIAFISENKYLAMD